MPYRLLVIEQESGEVSATFGGLLPAESNWRVEPSSWEAFVPERFACSANLVVAVALGQMHRAVPLFEWWQHHPISTPTFAILPAEADADSLRITTQVVDDFVLWPVRKEELHLRVVRLLNAADGEFAPGNDAAGCTPFLPQLVGRDPVFMRVLGHLQAFGRSEAPVLITGETGTGKEMCARAIHHLTARRDFPFIPVDCAAIPDHLFENELFGHARGAYTDAQSDQKGLVALANGGTLFLDEIDALSLPAQAKLLRFLEERVFRPLGSERFLKSDVRIVAATNRNIEGCVRAGAFRSDLYFRLNVLRLELPPLRERRGDIPLLAQHFAELLTKQSHSRLLSPPAVQKLSAYEWPGNVRELYNIMQRALVFADGKQVLPCHISVPGGEPSPPANGSEDFRSARARSIEAFEKQYVEDLLRRNNGNVTRAARAAHQDRRAFGRLAKKYGINPARN